MEETIRCVGLDVHKNGIAVAVADGGSAGEVRYPGIIDNTPEALDRLIARLGRPGRVEHPAQRIVLRDLIDAVDDADARCARLVTRIEEPLAHGSMAPVVTAAIAREMLGFAWAIARHVQPRAAN